MKTEEVFMFVVAWFIFMIVVCVKVENYCVERGWCGASVTFSLKEYCEARIDQTDVVVPLKEAWNRLGKRT